MKRTKIRKNRILIVLGMMLMLVMGSAGSLYAADNGSMPPLSGEPGTLTIMTEYTDEDVKTPISGVELTVYKVADLTVKNKMARYTATEYFKSADIDFNKMTTSSSIDAAQVLRDMIDPEKITGKTATSNEKGEAVFQDVEPGMYLIVQTGATGDALKYSTLEPYIVMAPQPMTETGEYSWEYDVVSIPKVQGITAVPTTGKETTTVKAETKNKTGEKGNSTSTGDNANLYLWIILAITSLAVLIVLLIARRRKAKNNA